MQQCTSLCSRCNIVHVRSPGRLAPTRPQVLPTVSTHEVRWPGRLTSPPLVVTRAAAVAQPVPAGERKRKMAVARLGVEGWRFFYVFRWLCCFLISGSLISFGFRCDSFARPHHHPFRYCDYSLLLELLYSPRASPSLVRELDSSSQAGRGSFDGRTRDTATGRRGG
jgi:hypothetical protein